MINDVFFRHVVSLVSLCYRKGCTDACWEGNEYQLMPFRERVRRPNSYGTLDGRVMPWKEWAHTLVLWHGHSGELEDLLMRLKSNQSSEAVYLRVFQEAYLCGASDYYNNCCAYGRKTMMNVRGMFLIDENGMCKNVSRKKLVSKVIELVYERIKSDEEYIAAGGLRKGILSRTVYESFIKSLWVASTSKNKWYD